MEYSYDDLYLVGIGSSAGGIEALKGLLANLPKDQPLAYIIVQHLNPQYKSMLTDILSRETMLNVEEITNGSQIEANKIYVTPANANVRVSGGRFHTASPEQVVGPKPSIDVLFVSLAQEKEQKAIGIVLSGTGSDGTIGLRAIKSSGGVTIAHDPKHAKYNGMPLSAIEEKVVDKIMLPEEMGPYLLHILSNGGESEFIDKASDALRDIFNLLNDSYGIDFSSYKSTTVLRRIEKRMVSAKIKTIEKYLQYIKENPSEIEGLYKDILIGVTSFYRDTDAFEALSNLLKSYLQAHSFPEFRAWSVGCSTGEEAYTLAIILSDLAEQLDKSITIQVFATDIDEDSLEQARSGIYPEIISTAISKSFLEKYFRKKGNMYEVVRSIREKVIFSKHNILKDPPFLRIDLVCCRNLLIYFEGDIQQKTLLNFHHALRPGGILFLGRSESLGKAGVYFSNISTKFKIFKSRADVKPQLFDMIIPRLAKSQSKETKAEGKKEKTIEDEIKKTLYNSFVSKLVVVDENGNLLFVKGDLDYLASLPKGSINLNFSKMIHEQLAVEFRSLLFKAAKTNMPQHGMPRVIFANNTKINVAISIYPLGHEISGYLVIFDEQEIKQKDLMLTSQIDDERYKELQDELEATKEHLQTVIEELETSNEELQASNEELQSSNEELQATNEELETSNEELQSSNEELQTAYIELKMVYEEQAKNREMLENTNKELLRLNNELATKEKYISALLDAEQAIVIVTRFGEELIDVNQGFFNFFSDYSSIEEFKANHKCICELFEDVVGDDDFLPSSGKKRDGKNWLELVMTGDRQYKAMINKHGKPYIFSVHANDLDIINQKFVVVFSNITDIEAQIAQSKHLTMKNIDEIRQKERATIQRAILYSMSEYISGMSLSWREPMAKLAILIKELLEDAEYEPINKERLKEFEKNSIAHLQRVLDLIDATREFFVLSKNKEYFNIVKLIDESVNTFKSYFKDGHIHVGKVKCEKEKIDFYGYADEMRILLHNIFVMFKNFFIDKSSAKLDIDITADSEYLWLTLSVDDEMMVLHNYLMSLIAILDEADKEFINEIEHTQMRIIKAVVESNLGGDITINSNAKVTQVVIKMKLKS